MDTSRIPPADTSHWHRTSVQMRFSDIDMFGHVNNGAYFQYADLGKFRFFTELMDEPFDPTKNGLVIANINCNFYQQTFMSETVNVLTALVHLGNSSLTIEQRIIADDQEIPHAIIRSILVQLDPATGLSKPFDAIWRQRLENVLIPQK